jgi:hypothetical protein
MCCAPFIQKRIIKTPNRHGVCHFIQKYNADSSSEMRIFSQGQGNQKIARRHTFLYAAQGVLKIDTEISEKGHFRAENYMNRFINSSITSSTFSGVMPNCLQAFSALSSRRGFSISLRRERYPSLLPTW